MTIADAIKRLQDYPPGDPCAFALWTSGDVKGQPHGGSLNKAEVAEVQDAQDRSQDASIGINWDTLDEHISTVAEARKERLTALEKTR